MNYFMFLFPLVGAAIIAAPTLLLTNVSNRILFPLIIISGLAVRYFMEYNLEGTIIFIALFFLATTFCLFNKKRQDEREEEETPGLIED